LAIAYTAYLNKIHVFRRGCGLKKVSKISVVALALILALLCCSSAQQPKEAAVVRGHFSGGNDVWHARDFGWFYYDLDKDIGGETLSIELKGRLAEKGHIVYNSRVWEDEFEYEPWGTYQAVAFLGKRYLAGYPESDLTKEVSSLEKGYLREVLIDDDEIHGLSTNSTLPLLGGYVLALSEISKSNEEASLVLLKNGKPVDVAVVSEGDSYVFKLEDIPVIMVHVSNIMRSEDSGIVEVNGVFQIGDIPAFALAEGDRLDNMEVTAISHQGLELKNHRDLNLLRDSLVGLADGLMITVVNSSILLYYPTGVISEYGYHEIRGPVFSADSRVPANLGQYKVEAEASWDPSNFSGFYFDSEKMIGTETLLLLDTVDRTIPPVMSKLENDTLVAEGLQYISNVQEQPFEFPSWGSYLVISLYGQPWFAGYGPAASAPIDQKDLLGQDYLSQVLIDSGDSTKAVAGNVFRLKEDYDFIIGDVGNDSILVQMLKAGRLVDTSVVRSNTTYVYKKDMADLDDVPLILLHVQNIFSNSSEKLAIIDGIFQISETTIPVEESLDLGETAILLSNPQIVVIGNPEKINLNRDSSTNLWPGLGLRVADNDTLRYYPFSVEYVVPKPSLPQEISYPRNVTALSPANFTMVVQAAEISQVIAEILDRSGNTVYSRDLTKSGRGSGDIWLYAWSWNASILKLSDDGSRIMDASSVPALLYVNSSAPPVQVGVRFDRQGKIVSIASSKSLFYIAPEEYARLNATLSYEAMNANQTARSDFIKIEPGNSLLRFFEFTNDTTRLSDVNHTITGSIQSLEPHAERMAAPPGRYELRVRIENTADALRVWGAYMEVNSSDDSPKLSEPTATPTKSEADVQKSGNPSTAAGLAALTAICIWRLKRRRPGD